MKKTLIASLLSLFVLAGANAHQKPLPKLKKGGDNFSSIKLPNGFSVKILATDLGATRHIAVSKNGDLYAKLSKLKDGKGIYLLRDTNKDGKIDETKLFGNYPGTGIFVNDDYLYASSNSGVYRYKLNAEGEVNDYEKPELIVSGLVDRKRDNAK